MIKLSAIIITKNEQRDLPGCLESLKGVADEIVVVDSRSTDRTREVAESHGAIVFERDWHGYGPQKQFALGQTTGDWVINLDADERLTPKLAAEITALLKTTPDVNGYEIPFRLYFLGRRLRFGGAWREKHLRLFRRDKGHYAGKDIHEGIEVREPLGRLRHPVRHESYKDFDEYLEKCARYTRLIARDKYRQGKRFHVWHHLRLPWEFLARYILKGGFLDGNAGFIYAALSAYYAWLKHVRLLDGPHDH